MHIKEYLDHVVPPILYETNKSKIIDFVYGTLGYMGLFVVLGAITFPIRLILKNTPIYILWLDVALSVSIFIIQIILIHYFLIKRKWVAYGALPMFIFSILAIILHIYLQMYHGVQLLPTF